MAGKATEKTDSKDASKKGEMRRRWQAILEDGSLAGLGSEGRLVASYVQFWAKFETCEIRFSMRYVAKYLGVQLTTVRRGVSQMVDGGILEVTNASAGGGRTTYVVVDRTEVSESDPRTLRAQGCAQGVRTPNTLRAQGAHATCAARAQPVRGARTLCARNKYLFIDSPKRINEGISEDTPDAGHGPAPSCLTTPDTAAGEAAAG
jgi:hypothetical protein